MGLSAAELEARRDQRLHTAETFRRGRTPLEIIAVVAHAAGAAEAATEAAKAREPPRSAPACREGCAWCCHQVIGAAPPEVLRIAGYLRQTLPPERWAALCERVRVGHERRRALAAGTLRRARLPCPLLENDRCLAYPVRPLTCRGFNSSDARRCEQAIASPGRVEVPDYAPQRRLATLVLDGLRAGVQENRLEGELLELTAALHLACADANAEARWLAGQKVFAAARLP